METTEQAKQHQRSHGDQRQKHHHGGQKKKTGTLPLIMFLSMDEDSVLPGCPNASNPFHKCAGHCSQRIRSENGKKGNIEQRKPQTTNCVHASNPFHVCSESCSKRSTLQDGRAKGGVVAAERISNKERGADERAVNRNEGKNDGRTQQTRMVHPQCPHASNPFHICAELCLQRIAGYEGAKDGGVGRISNKDRAERAVVVVKEKKDGVQVAERMVHPSCPNASNPFHVCAEACFQMIPAKDKANKFDPLGSKVPIAKYANVATRCKYASNPFHNCDEYCFESEPGKYRAKIRDKEKRKRVAKMEEKTVQSKLDSTSEDQKTVEDFIERTPEDLVQEDESEDDHEDLKITEMNVQLECINTHELHRIYADYNSIQRKPVKDQDEEGKSKLYPTTSSIVFSEYIFVLVYIIHLIVIAIAYSKRK